MSAEPGANTASRAPAPTANLRRSFMATWTFVRALFNPRLIVPSVRVPSIQHVDFQALKRAGYKGAVFDKDNCLTLPHRDRLVPQLRDSWAECLKTFGPENVIIVSNATGTRKDPGFLEAESVAYNLGISVLAHTTPKPGCSSTIANYFASPSRSSQSHLLAASPPPPSPYQLPLLSSLPYASSPSPSTQPLHSQPIKPSELIVVGDRVLTDVLLANTLGALPIWTTGLWQRELMPMRYVEYTLVRLMDVWLDRARIGRRVRRMWVRMSARAGALAGRRKQPTKEQMRELDAGIPEPDPASLPLSPQQMFVRPPPPPPVQTIEPSTLRRVASLTGSVLRVSWRGASVATVWSFRRVRSLLRSRQQKSGSAPGSGLEAASASGPELSQPITSRMASLARRSASGLFSLARSGVTRLVGKERIDRTGTTLHQISSRIGVLGRRIMRSVPFSSS